MTRLTLSKIIPKDTTYFAAKTENWVPLWEHADLWNARLTYMLYEISCHITPR